MDLFVQQPVSSAWRVPFQILEFDWPSEGAEKPLQGEAVPPICFARYVYGIQPMRKLSSCAQCEKKRKVGKVISYMSTGMDKTTLIIQPGNMK